MAIVNLRDSLDHALSEMFEFWRYDAWIIVDDQIPIERLVNEAESVPGVTNAEGWGFTVARYVRPDDTESDNLYLIAPPAGTPLLDPPVIAGRRLRPGDTDAIIVSPGLLANEPTLYLGGPMNVKIEGLEKTYTIVGIMNMLGNSSIGYFTIMDYSTESRQRCHPDSQRGIHRRAASNYERGGEAPGSSQHRSYLQFSHQRRTRGN